MRLAALVEDEVIWTTALRYGNQIYVHYNVMERREVVAFGVRFCSAVQ